MLNRWAASSYDRHPSSRLSIFGVSFITEENFELLFISAIFDSQKRYPPSNESGLKLNSSLEVLNSSLWTDRRNSIFIPPEDEELIVELLEIIAILPLVNQSSRKSFGKLWMLTVMSSYRVVLSIYCMRVYQKFQDLLGTK